MRKPSFGGKPPILELPTFEGTPREATFMYTPSDQSTRDVEGLSVFESDGQIDRDSVYTESDKGEAKKEGYRLFGIIPYYISVACLALFVSLLALTIGLVLYYYLHGEDYQKFRTQIHTECSNKATAIEKQISGIAAAFGGVSFWLDMSPESSRTQSGFDLAVRLATANSMNTNAVEVIAYAPLVNDSDRAAWESQYQTTIKQSQPDNSLITSEQKPYYFPVQWQSPVGEFILGLDVYSSPVRSDALNQTLLNKTPTLTPFFSLVIANVTGFCVYYPVYQNYSMNDDALSAIVAVCFGADIALNEALEGLQDYVTHVRVMDHFGTVGYETTGSQASGYNETMEFSVMNETWVISCYENYTAQPFAAVILSIILLIGFLATIAIMVCSRRYHRTSNDAIIHKFRYNRSKRRAQAILQSIPDPLLVLNGDGRVVDCNQQALHVFGVDHKKRLLGCHIKHLFVSSFTSALIRDNVIQPGLHEVRVKRHQTGEYFIAEANFSYVEDINDANDEKPFMTQVVLMRDVSAKKEAALQLQNAKQQAEDTNQQKSQFLAFVCHELRNPLHVISGMSELLNNMVVQPDKQEYVRNIITSSNHMQSIVNDVLDIAQLSENELRLNYQPFNLKQLLEDEGKFMMRSIQEQEGDVKGVVNISYSVPEYVNSDSTRITQLIKNLVDNAIKFTQQGVVTLEVSASDKKNPDSTIENVLFLISDTGIGIPVEHQDEIFQPFSKANISMGNHFGSSGIGLSIVHHLVDLMGGSIEVESEVNVGTTFKFTLPLALATEDDFLAFQSANDSTSSTALSPVSNFGPSAIKPTLLLERPQPKSSWSIASNASNDQSIGRSDEQDSLLVNRGSETNLISSASTDARLSSCLSLSGLSNGGTSSGEHDSDAVSTPNSVHEGGSYSTTRKDYFGALDTSELGTIEEKPVCLVAEDNELCQKIATKMLGKEYVVEIAANGQIAVDTVMAAPDRFNIIIMDIIMPEMDGIQATIELRKNGIKIPIIAVTANAAEADKKEAMRHGFNGYITKPYKRNLLTAMQRALSAAKQESSSS
ncbi:hypothetical protein K450DRAFT_280328 [Umbelopsis ramanniana AG]|uniref:histidine kinase n=1 Tax=Umbelopsis ramanniana AG TaxID=1314678 RepID=A0AAD5E9H3_UMBRA|nr:uncharacterized protein K450DRAFT_280328 [Umbelopsis ramanniana AG]KAI8579868.1 hypothetical protein K450DRAFT_280328 [Umbelopsis ramanniana AG]